MTQLPPIEREEFIQSLNEYASLAQSEGSILGLLIVDIGNLKAINHQFGYEYGDNLLRDASDKLLGVSKLPNTVFRVGSHYFGFILPKLSSVGFITLAINKVSVLLSQDLLIDEDVVPVSIHIGIAVSERGEIDALSMLTVAEVSLANVQRGGEHQLEDFSTIRPRAQQDFLMEQMFRETLHDNNFLLYYQPKINLLTGEADHAEAVLRWQLSNGEFVSPEQTVEMAQALGGSFALTRWVVQTAVRQLREWQRNRSISLALNIQADLINHPSLRPLVEDTLTVWGAEPGSITLEITESAVIEDKESGFSNLLKLKELGVDLSIDDFGTGYSSMAYFKHIPASELKIDQYFVKSMKDDSLDRDLVRIMIDTAHLFGMRAVAEGVEDVESFELLKKMDCDYVQGYYFSRPLPAAEFEQWLDQWQGF